MDSSKVNHIRDLAEHSMWGITGADRGIDAYIIIWGEIYSPSFMALPRYDLENKMSDAYLKGFESETS